MPDPAASANVVALLAQAAAHTPVRPALIWRTADGGAASITYAALWARVQRVAAGLQGAGLRRRDRAIVMIPMSADLYAVLPVNKQVGFFSDAYCIEWSYGKAVLVRKLLAQTLAANVARGQYTIPEALSIAREILYETPRLNGMRSKDNH